MKIKNKLLITYAIIIFVLLILIIFIMPDSFFLGRYKEVELPQNNTKVEHKEFIDYEIQKEELQKNNFEYEYLLLDSMGTKTYTYKCSGKISDNIESGTCESPEKFSYTESTKKDAFSKIDINYLNPRYLFELLKNIEPVKTEYQTLREYKYVTKIEDIETEIIVFTNLNEITKVEISNAYMTYIIKYNIEKVDN